MSKPIIRHCKNCAYYKAISDWGGYCSVKYQEISAYKQRKKGLFCWFFNMKGGAE